MFIIKVNYKLCAFLIDYISDFNRKSVTYDILLSLIYKLSVKSFISSTPLTNLKLKLLTNPGQNGSDCMIF